MEPESLHNKHLEIFKISDNSIRFVFPQRFVEKIPPDLNRDDYKFSVQIEVPIILNDTFGFLLKIISDNSTQFLIGKLFSRGY